MLDKSNLQRNVWIWIGYLFYHHCDPLFIRININYLLTIYPQTGHLCVCAGTRMVKSEMPTSTRRSPRCRRRSCVWSGPRSTPANRGSPFVSLVEATQAGRQRMFGAGWPQAWYWRPRELLSTLFLKSFLFWTSPLSLSVSLLCSSSQSGYALHCSFNLHLNQTWLKSVCFSQFMSLSNKSVSQWWEDVVTGVGSSAVYTHSNPGSSGLSPCFFLLHFDWSVELIITTYHFPLWISRKKIIPNGT